jgi:Pyridoxamine 5'-phosphate oxidase
MTEAQGALELLQSEVAQRLLASALPARVAYIARDGTPRVVPSWFQWTEGEVVMPTFVAAPHIGRPAARLRDLRANPDVAISIDTETQPPQVLLLRGRAELTEVDGVVPEYAASARQYMGEEAAREYLAMIDQPGTRMARVAMRPAWVGLIDFETRLPANMKV